MNIVYLQCDIRFNKWLICEMIDATVIEHTIQRIKQIKCERIVAGIFDCKENLILVELLRECGVEVLLSKEENVNKRFLDLVTEISDVNYIVRVGGDQVLIDSANINKILKEMEEQDSEWFFEYGINGVLPDIVKEDCLREHKSDLLDEKRYFDGLLKCKNIKRYHMPLLPAVAFGFRVNCEEGYRICKCMLMQDLDVYEVSRDLMMRLSDSNNYLVKTGLWGSWLLTGKNDDFFYDEEKEINPWWGKTVVDLIKERLHTDIYVFEWGAGNSTMFWSARAQKVISVEHDEGWYENIRGKLSENVKLVYCELEYGGEYCKKILEEEEPFDVVLIDGRDRVRCAKNAVEKLKDNGIIIWDNSDRESYREGCEFLEKGGFKQLKLGSVVYGVPGAVGVTSIFYRECNLLGL